MDNKITWKRIEFAKDYFISENGEVLSKKIRGKNLIRSQSINASGYKTISIITENGKKTFLVHRLVAKAFIDNPDEKETVNHIDGNKLNNNVNNLEWATFHENLDHAIEKGLRKKKKIFLVCATSKKIVKEFESQTEAGRFLGVSASSINRALREKGLTCNFFVVSKKEEIAALEKKRKKGRKVEKIDRNTLETLKVYCSMAEAAQEVGCTVQSISFAIKRKSISKNFLWRFADEKLISGE